MKYDYLYKDLLEKIDRLEALRDLNKEVHPSGGINNLLKKLDTADSGVRVDEKLHWWCLINNEFKYSAKTSLKIASFEDFRKDLIQGLADFLVKVVAYENKNLGHFMGEPLRKSEEMIKK